MKHIMNTSVIRVYDNKLKRMANRVRIVLSIDGVFSGGMTKEVYTNDQGVAYLQHSSTGMATVYIDGKEVGRMRVPGEGHFTV
jgi:hypothetical protein